MAVILCYYFSEEATSLMENAMKTKLPKLLVSQNKYIYSTLFEVGALGLGTVTAPNGTSELKLYSINGTVVIVQDFGEDGAEIYAPIIKGNSVTALMSAIRDLAQ